MGLIDVDYGHEVALVVAILIIWGGIKGYGWWEKSRTPGTPTPLPQAAEMPVLDAQDPPESSRGSGQGSTPATAPQPVVEVLPDGTRGAWYRPVPHPGSGVDDD